MPEVGISPLVWGAALLAPLAVLLAVVSALLERSGPIRLRHWVEGAGGPLRKLYEQAPRFAAFRVLLSLAARLLPLLLFVLLARLLAVLGVRGPLLWAFAGTALVVLVSEATNRGLVGRDPEGALRRLTASTASSICCSGRSSCSSRRSSPASPSGGRARRRRRPPTRRSRPSSTSARARGSWSRRRGIWSGASSASATPRCAAS